MQRKEKERKKLLQKFFNFCTISVVYHHYCSVCTIFKSNFNTLPQIFCLLTPNVIKSLFNVNQNDKEKWKARSKITAAPPSHTQWDAQTSSVRRCSTHMHLGGAAAEQIDEGGVEGHDGVSQVYTVLFLLLLTTEPANQTHISLFRLHRALNPTKHQNNL